MVTQNDVVAAVSAALTERYPDSTVYTNLVPSKFQRPSFLVENTDIALVASTVSTVTLQLTVRVVCFVAIDEYHNSQLEVLNVRQLKVLGIFAPLYLKVGDRALKVQQLGGSSGGRDWIDVTAVLAWDVGVVELAEIVEPPLGIMEEINLNMEEYDHGNAEH